MKKNRTYHKNGYTVTDSEPIRIGYSNVYIGRRSEVDGEDKFDRIIVYIMGDGVHAEIDTTHLPTPEQCKDIRKLFLDIAKEY